LIGKVIGRFPSFSYECLDSIRADVTPFLPSDFKLDCFEQGKISRALESRQFQNLLATSSPLEKARLIAAARPRAGSFLNVVPNAALGTILQSAEFNVAVAYRIGSPILPNPTVCPARNCDKTLDIYGHHAVRCKAQGDITHRHHRIRDLIYKKCQSALLQPLLEPIGMLRDCGLKPADVAIPDFILSKPLATDEAVTDPLRLDVIPRSSSESFSAANDYAVNVKHRKYSRLIRDGEIVFKAVVAETLGGWSDEAVEFFAFLSSSLAKRSPSSSFALEARRLYEQLSISLQKSNARMILSRINHTVI
jgi:hypothetical protein